MEKEQVEELTQSPVSTVKKPFWQTNVFIIISLLLLWPLGLVLMWAYSKWKKSVKIFLTILFVLLAFVPFILLIILLQWYVGQSSKNYENGPVPSSTAKESKLYYVENMGKYSKLSSPEYKFSFEFPSELNYLPPFGGSTNDLNVQFYSKTRSEKKAVPQNLLQFSPSETKYECTPGNDWTELVVNGLKAVKLKNAYFDVVIICGDDIHYTFSYFAPDKGVLSNQDLDKEKEAVQHMLNTFKILK